MMSTLKSLPKNLRNIFNFCQCFEERSCNPMENFQDALKQVFDDFSEICNSFSLYNFQLLELNSGLFAGISTEEGTYKIM